MVEKNWGKRNFGLDSLKSMNRDMEEKGILLRELRCRTASAAVRLHSSPAGVARRQSGSSAQGIQSLSPPFLFLRSATEAPAGGARRQSGRVRDCTPGAELPLSSPRQSCSSAGPQDPSYALIGGEWGSGR
jgi:hypothetical protein